jgi:hypothetical protein
MIDLPRIHEDNIYLQGLILFRLRCLPVADQRITGPLYSPSGVSETDLEAKSNLNTKSKSRARIQVRERRVWARVRDQGDA